MPTKIVYLFQEETFQKAIRNWKQIAKNPAVSCRQKKDIALKILFILFIKVQFEPRSKSINVAAVERVILCNDADKIHIVSP